MATGNAVRMVSLPENLQHLIPADGEDNSVLVQQFKENQAKRFKASLERRVKRFEEKLGDKTSKEHQVLVRRILIQNLRNEIDERRDAKKQLNAEIKALRGNKTRNKSTKQASK